METCIKCGAALAVTEIVSGVCYLCERKSEEEIRITKNVAQKIVAEPQKIIVKTYTGGEGRATALFQKDAASMADKGYFPTAQSYAPGTYGCGSFLGALLLCIVIIGILIFIYMLLVKPDGILSVTYEYRGTAVTKALEEKTCPKCAEQVKAAAKVCRFCEHEF